MPEIIFKGKTPAGEWVKGYYASKDNKAYIITVERADAVGEYFEAVEVFPESAFMGLNFVDKNGQQIFAGDILRRHKGELIVIAWSEFESMFNALLYVEKRQRYAGAAFIRDIDIEKYEIIGNMLDNPELIQEAKTWQPINE
jgi:hypothetical protein